MKKTLDVAMIVLLVVMFVALGTWAMFSVVSTFGIWYSAKSGMATLSPTWVALTSTLEWFVFSLMLFWSLRFMLSLEHDVKKFLLCLTLLVYPIVVYQVAWAVSSYVDHEFGSLLSRTRFGVVWVAVGLLVVRSLANWNAWLRKAANKHIPEHP